MKLFFVILLGMTMLSCERISLKKDLESLYSLPVVMPKLNAVYNGKDSVVSEYSDSYKYIVYVDSTRCNSCEFHRIFCWQGILNYSKAFNDNLRIYFIFSPSLKDKKKFDVALLGCQLNYPIYIDRDDEFMRLNPHMRKNKLVGAFMIDPKGNVVLVGDPSYNKQVEKIFYQYTQSLNKE